MKRYQWFILITVILSVISLFMEQAAFTSPVPRIISSVIDYLLLSTVLAETIYDFAKSKYKNKYVRDNLFSLVFTGIFLILFIYNKFIYSSVVTSDLAILAVLIRNVFIVLKIYSRVKKLSGYMERFTANPAQTILLSFFFVILVGALILMMGFTSAQGKGLNFVDALFTATSAVCVTGLVVVDTATYFSIWGQLVIMLLIQIGGLGIMILSFFTIFLVRRRISLADKMLISYMLSEDDSSNLQKALSYIVVTTLIIELIGAAALFIGFFSTLGLTWKNVFYSIFHSISAFCNGGFALYSDSLEGFRQNPLVTMTIAFLIILGGIGFGIITNGRKVFGARVANLIHGRRGIKGTSLALNTRIVLKYTGILLLAGTLFIYILEHDNTMKAYGLFEQYMAAFFQSVTLRTAGFNSIPFNNLKTGTYVVMIILMFIGAASGSTGGGIKVNTVSVLLASFRMYLTGKKTVTIRHYAVSDDKVLRAFIIFVAGIIAVMAGALILSIMEQTPFIYLVFETVSAVGTVGISAGITASLTGVSKITLILLMFWGRLGALTILSAAGKNDEKVNISWPQADISIG